MAEVKELTREETLDIEAKALQTLLNYGLRFSVPLKITPKTSSWFI